MAASLLDIRYKIDGLNFSIASPEHFFFGTSSLHAETC